MDLIREIGRRMELKEGKSLSDVVREMKKEGYCISTHGISASVGRLSLWEFLNILPVRRHGVSLAEDIDGLVIYSPEASFGSTLFIADKKGEESILINNNKTLTRIDVNRLAEVTARVKTQDLIIVANKKYAESQKMRVLITFLTTTDIKACAVFPSSAIIPSIKTSLSFPLIRGLNRERFSKMLADLPRGGRSAVMVVQGKGKKPFFFLRIDGKDRATDILKVYIHPQSKCDWVMVANHMSFIASKKLLTEHLPIKVSPRMKQKGV